MNVLILGASGMLGNAMMRVLSEHKSLKVYGTVRSASSKRFFNTEIAQRIIPGCEVENPDSLHRAFSDLKPDVVINCVGLVKQLADANDTLAMLQINAVLPHRLSRICALTGSRLIHMSTDCVFSGRKGGYTEDDESDALDIYGKSKFLGELHEPYCLTIRTSIIGHELESAHGLVNWFLSQRVECKGYKKAIFSGLPTVELARIVRDIVIPREGLSGLYHVAADPISKYELLQLISERYGKAIEIIPEDFPVIDRSLKGNRFKAATGYTSPVWEDLIKLMHSYQ